jgi:tRNA dimethylallyltransferase
MQVYRGMNIGTDKFRSENYGIKQYMVDISDPDNPVTVVEFRDICRKVIEDEFLKKGKIPLVAGGSGLYIRAVIDDLEFTPEAIIDDRNIREKVKNDIRKYGLKRVFEDLQFIDPVYSKKISSNDERRIIRAIEVFELTGIPFSHFQKKWNERVSIYNISLLGLIRQKESLMECIVSRVESMFNRGLVSEVKNLVSRGYGSCYSIKQAVGYKEVISYLNGEVSIDDCKKEVIKNTKKLAKKQLTWFKADPRINWLRTDNYDNIFNLIIDAIRIITRDIAQGYNFHE